MTGFIKKALIKVAAFVASAAELMRISRCDVCQRWTILTITRDIEIGGKFYVRHYCAACLNRGNPW